MSSKRFRLKKLNIKTNLPVLREDQVDPNEYESVTAEGQIATGVELAEEKVKPPRDVCCVACTGT